MGQLQKLNDRTIRIDCSCGNVHKFWQDSDGKYRYQELKKSAPAAAPPARGDAQPGGRKPPKGDFWNGLWDEGETETSTDEEE